MGYCKGNNHLTNDESELSKYQYMCCQMLMPEKDMFYINKITGKKIFCNRHNVWTQLSQHYVVDQLSRFIDTRLQHQQQLNSTSFKTCNSCGNDSDSDSDDSFEDTGNGKSSNTKSILGESLTGSARHLRKLGLNAMEIVNNHDKPHIFLTLTSDSNWPEILEKIESKQTAFSRPDITTQVFHERTEALLHNLRNGKYFKFSIDIDQAQQYTTVSDPENDVYTGSYENNKFSNFGVLEQVVQDCKVIYTGHWKGGTRHGNGELNQPYNVKFTGEFENNIPSGLGTLQVQRNFNSCSNYRITDGNSTMSVTTIEVEGKSYNLETYTGVWKDGTLYIRENSGKTYRIQYDGVTFYGHINSENKANGEGCLLFPDGTEYKGIFTNNKIEVTNKVQYEMRVTEYQHRGLPHLHYVARLTNMPKAECMLVQWINQNISTKGFQDFDSNDTVSDEYKLKEIIREKMQHNCSKTTDCNPRGCLKDDGVTCRKFFHTTRESTTAFFDKRGFPKYKRDKEDLKIVPYNPLICLDWEGHANLEFTECSYAIGYLYKYIFKGNTKVQVAVSGGKNDEISYFLKTRKICSMDAVNRFLGYPTYPKPNPAVKTIKVKLPYQMDLILHENRLCDLFVYFQRHSDLRNLTYQEFFKKYTYIKKSNKKRKLDGSSAVTEVEREVTSPILKSTKKVKLEFTIVEKKKTDTLIRLQGLSLKSGEICYLRMLLKRRPAVSYDDLLTFNGIKYSTFQESAKQHGYLKDMEFLKEEFLEIFKGYTQHSKRRMHYAIWLGQDYPVNFMFNDGKYCNPKEKDTSTEGYFYKEMVYDWIVQGFTTTEIKNKFLAEIDKLLNDVGLNNTIFGLPKPVTYNSELEYEQSKYSREEQAQLFKQLEADYPCNKDQQKFLEFFQEKFHYITSNESAKPIFMFLTGSGGTGKSCVLEKVAALVRSEGYICKVSAATALAASIYSDATTFHSLARIPVIEECDKDLDYSIKLNLSDERRDLLLAAKVIIIDEAFFSNRETLEAFYYSDKLDGLRGKIILLAGDRKQFLPVAEGGNKYDQIAICLSSSEVWKLVKKNIFQLTENMRLTRSSNMSPEELDDQIFYAKILEDIGNQKSDNIEAFKDEKCSDDEQIYKLKCTNQFVIDTLEETEEVLDLGLCWLFENGFNENAVISSAVIVGTNNLVNMWNKRIQKLNTKEEKLYHSNDYLADIDDDNGHIKAMLSTKVLNSRNHSSAPPHELKLKIGDVCILTRYYTTRIYFTLIYII